MTCRKCAAAPCICAIKRITVIERDKDAEIAALVKDRDTWREGYNRVAERMAKAEADNRRLRAENRRLRRALREIRARSRETRVDAALEMVNIGELSDLALRRRRATGGRS